MMLKKINPTTKRRIGSEVIILFMFGSKEYIDLLSILLIPEELRVPSELSFPVIEGIHQCGIKSVLTFDLNGSKELVCTHSTFNRRGTAIRISKRLINSLDDLYVPFVAVIGKIEYNLVLLEDGSHTSLALAELADTIKAPIDEAGKYVDEVTLGCVKITVNLPERTEENIPAFYKITYAQMSARYDDKLITTFLIDKNRVKFMSKAELVDKLISYYKAALSLINDYDTERELLLLQTLEGLEEAAQNQRFINEQLAYNYLST